VHPGHTVEEVAEHTGFEFDTPERVHTTLEPDAEILALIRGPVRAAISGLYPQFAARVFGANNKPDIVSSPLSMSPPPI
jgi:glutaconate CoA-transferase subunit B